MTTAPGWYPDPSGRYEHRFHNGTAWTADVAVGGRRFVDPAGSAPPAAPTGSRGAVGPAGPSGFRDRRSGRNRLAVTALVLGIVAAGAGWLPFLGYVTIAAALAAIAFGLAGRRRAERTGTGGSFATAGLVLGAIGIPVSIVGMVLTVVVLGALDRYENPPDHEVQVTACTLTGDAVRATGELTNRSEESASFTIRVELSRRAAGRDAVIDRVDVDDVEPGATTAWTATGRPDGGPDGAPKCSIEVVRGPLPYGVDPGY
jgi:hypothetical protein